MVLKVIGVVKVVLVNKDELDIVVHKVIMVKLDRMEVKGIRVI